MDKVLEEKEVTVYYLTEDGFRDAATGGKDPNIGTWDSIKRIATLKKDITQTIKIIIDNATLDGEDVNCIKHSINGATDYGIYIKQRENVTIKNLVISNSNKGIYLDQCIKTSILENLIANNQIGVFLERCYEIDIRDNVIKDNVNNNIYLDYTNNKIFIKNNYIENSISGISMFTLNSNIEIIGNKITCNSNDVNYYGIKALADFNSFILIEDNYIKISKKITAANIEIKAISFEVNLSLNCNNIRIINNTIEISKSKIIYNEIDSVSNFAAISLGSGIFGKSEVRDNKIKIYENTFETIINRSNEINYFQGIVISSNNADLSVEKNEVLLIKNIIEGYSSEDSVSFNYFVGIGVASPLISLSIKSNNITIKDNINLRRKPTKEGYIAAVFFTNIRSSLICGNTNTIENNSLGIGDFFGYYFNSDNSGNNILENKITIIKNKGDFLYGINFYNSESNTIKGNEIKIIYNTAEWDYYSLYFERICNNNKVEENTIVGNQGYGLYTNLIFEGNIIIKNNISSNEEEGIYFLRGCFAAVIKENYIYGNGGTGLYLSTNCFRNLIQYNKIINNSGYGVRLRINNNENWIENNVVTDNKLGDIYIEEGNYGNKVRHNVTSNNIN